MVIGPGSSQARLERARSSPTSSITIATSGRLRRSRKGTALRRQVCSAGNTAATFVTGGFTWLFVLYSLFAVAVCAWLIFSKVGSRVRLGGPNAKPEYSNFAWYSMLFACGQGIGLIFWSVAQPIMLRDQSPVVEAIGTNVASNGIVWAYFHWGFTAWAMYCVVAVCLAYSHHNLGKTLTFREATVDMFLRAYGRR